MAINFRFISLRILRRPGNIAGRKLRVSSSHNCSISVIKGSDPVFILIEIHIFTHILPVILNILSFTLPFSCLIWCFNWQRDCCWLNFRNSCIDKIFFIIFRRYEDITVRLISDIFDIFYIFFILSICIIIVLLLSKCFSLGSLFPHFLFRAKFRLFNRDRRLFLLFLFLPLFSVQFSFSWFSF